jgi:hypothetical protein
VPEDDVAFLRGDISVPEDDIWAPRDEIAMLWGVIAVLWDDMSVPEEDMSEGGDDISIPRSNTQLSSAQLSSTQLSSTRLSSANQLRSSGTPYTACTAGLQSQPLRQALQQALFGFGQINAQLFEFAVEVGAF